jgi:hypothetical protein
MALADFLKGAITQQFWANSHDAGPGAVGQSAEPAGTRRERQALSIEALESRVAPLSLAKGGLGHQGFVTLDYLLRD